MPLSLLPQPRKLDAAALASDNLEACALLLIPFSFKFYAYTLIIMEAHSQGDVYSYFDHVQFYDA